MPNGRNAERIFGRNAEGRNVDSYFPISGGMPKTRGSRNESVSVTKISSAPDRVRERRVRERLGLHFWEVLGHIFRVHNKT